MQDDTIRELAKSASPQVRVVSINRINHDGEEKRGCRRPHASSRVQRH